MNSPGNWTKSDSTNDHSRSEFADLRLRFVLARAGSREALVDRQPFGDTIGWHFLGGGVGVRPSLDESTDFPESDDGRPGGHACGVVVAAAYGASGEPGTAPGRIGVHFPSRRGQEWKSHNRRASGCAGIEANATLHTAD